MSSAWGAVALALPFALVLGAMACGGAACRAAEPSSHSPEAASPARDEPNAAAASGFAQPPPVGAPEGAAPTAPKDALSGRAEEKKKEDADDELAAEALDTLAQAEAALKRYSERLAIVAPVERVAPGGGAAGAGRSAPKPAATAAAPASKAGPDTQQDCREVCRAYGGLKRAADAVCRLAGDGSERCGRAKKLVSENRLRVTPCGCGE